MSTVSCQPNYDRDQFNAVDGESRFYMQIVLLSLTISPNIEPVSRKIIGQNILSLRRANLTTYFTTHRINIICEQR